MVCVYLLNYLVYLHEMQLRYIIFGVVLIVVLYAIAKMLRKERKQQQSAYEEQRREAARPEDNFNTIFLTLYCYRDEHACAETLFSMFNEAACPWRLRVAVVHYVHPKDQGYAFNIHNLYEHVVLRHDATSFQPLITVLELPHDTSTGPWDARKRATEELFHKERFYMTVDCRTVFVRNWDSLCMEQYARCLKLSPRPILTTLPAMENPEAPLETHPTYPVDGEAVPFERSPVRPFPTPVACPAWFFASSRILDECPLIALPYLTDEEGTVVMSARYYTHGWDFYTPTDVLAYRKPRSSKTCNLAIDRPDTRASREQQQNRAKGLLNPHLCRFCDEEHTDEFSGHDFEPWDTRAIYGKARSLVRYFEYANGPHPGLTSQVTSEEQVAKFGRVLYTEQQQN